SPYSAETLFSVATFYVNTKKPQSALRYLGRILGSTADYDATVFSAFGALGVEFEEISKYGGMPAQTRPARSYFQNALSSGDLKNAKQAWAWMRSKSLLDDRLADQYANLLV